MAPMLGIFLFCTGEWRSEEVDDDVAQELLGLISGILCDWLVGLRGEVDLSNGLSLHAIYLFHQAQVN